MLSENFSLEKLTFLAPNSTVPKISRMIDMSLVWPTSVRVCTDAHDLLKNNNALLHDFLFLRYNKKPQNAVVSESEVEFCLAMSARSRLATGEFHPSYIYSYIMV